MAPGGRAGAAPPCLVEARSRQKVVGQREPSLHDSAMSDFVETDRLVLRQFTADGADLLIELDSDPEVMRHLTGGEPTLPPAVVRERVIPNVLATYERWDGRFGLFAAYVKEGGDFIGWFQLRPEREGPLDEVELGYRLRRDAWDKGYATEAARALLDKGFSELGLRVVWGETMAVNLASRRSWRRSACPSSKRSPPPTRCRASRARSAVASGSRSRRSNGIGDDPAAPNSTRLSPAPSAGGRPRVAARRCSHPPRDVQETGLELTERSQK